METIYLIVSEHINLLTVDKSVLAVFSSKSEAVEYISENKNDFEDERLIIEEIKLNDLAKYIKL